MEKSTSNNTVTGLAKAGASAAFGYADWQLAMASGAIGVLLYSAWNVYQRITEVKPFSSADLARHRQLKTIFLGHFPGCKIPDIWILDDQKKPPTSAPDFDSIQQEAYSECENLQQFQSINHEVRSQLFLLIGRLFESVLNRHTIKNIFIGNIRPDGIEVMFFCHLIFWLKHCAPNYHEKDPETLVIYRKILAYCQALDDVVIIRNSGDLSRSNPLLTLQRIIHVLEGHCTALKEIQDAYTFEDYNYQLRNTMLGLASHTFNLVYFLIDKTTEKKLIPYRFQNPQEAETKIKNIRNTQLGEWLAQTLHTVGITHSTFVPTKRLNHAQIQYHLLGQHPEDPEFNRKKILFYWGHRPFVHHRSNGYADPEKKASIYLSSIRRILQLNLQVYFLLQQQAEAAKVNEVHGSVWIYGHRAGKATLIEFLNSVLWVTQALEQEINVFWESYYQDFKEYTAVNNITASIKEFAPLAHMNNITMKAIENLNVNIRQIIDKIKKQIAQFPSDNKLINQSKFIFMREVLEFRRFIQQTNSEEFKILEEEYQKMVEALKLVRTVISDLKEGAQPTSRPRPKKSKTSAQRKGGAQPASLPRPKKFMMAQAVSSLFSKSQNPIKNQSEAKLNTDTLRQESKEEEATAKGLDQRQVIKADLNIDSLQSPDTAQTSVPVPLEKLPLCHEVTELLLIPKYLLSLKTSYPPLVNEYCFEKNNRVLQYTYLNQQGKEATQPILDKKDLETLGGETFKCDEEHLKRYQRDLLRIINPKAVIRYDSESKFHLNLLKTKPQPLGSSSDKLKFHSKMQEEIYLKFLQEYNDVVNTAEIWTYARVSNHRLLVDLYQRVNAVYHRLYLEADGKPAPTLTQGELIYIDGLLFHTIMKEFKTHQYHDGFILNEDYLQIDFDFNDEQLLIPLNGLIMNITRKPIQRMMFESATNISEKEAQIQRLTKDKSVLQEQIAQKNSDLKSHKGALLEKDKIIAELRQQVMTKDSEIIEQCYQINAKNDQISAQDAERTNDKKIMASLTEQINRLQQQLEHLERKTKGDLESKNQFLSRMRAQLKVFKPSDENRSSFFARSNSIASNRSIQSQNLGVSNADETHTVEP